MATRRPKLESSGRRVIAYLRTSTDKQDLAAQQTGIVEFAKRNGFQPIAFYEEQVSGRTPVKDRKLGREVLPSLKPGDVLLVSELSRLGRTTLDVLQALATVAERGAEVHVVKGGHKVDGSMQSKVFVAVMALAAEIERDLISARTREGLQRARAIARSRVVLPACRRARSWTPKATRSRSWQRRAFAR
jgi:DNA invertase Pin-like site-specific DNA recombinase